MNFTLRLSEEIYKKLKEISYEEDRSFNREINYIIKKYIQEQDERKQNKKKNNTQ